MKSAISTNKDFIRFKGLKMSEAERNLHRRVCVCVFVCKSKPNNKAPPTLPFKPASFTSIQAYKANVTLSSFYHNKKS